MLKFLFGKKQTADIPQRLYGVVMARARDPQFFATFGVPDTVMGRFDMLSLHVYLFSRRMKKQGTPTALDLSQAVFDCYTEDVERALRQLGIGDQTVPKRKKKMIRSFYGQIEDFDGTLDTGDRQALAMKTASRFLAQEQPTGEAQLLANYMIFSDRALGQISFDAFLRGEFDWPNNQMAPQG